MGTRPRGPLPGWQPTTPLQGGILADALARYAQHEAEGTLPRPKRGIFYDNRPTGSGNGVRYIKHPPMRRVNGGQQRRVNPMDASPENVVEVIVLAQRAGLIPDGWIGDVRAPSPDVPLYDDVETAEEIAARIVSMARDPRLEYSPQTGQPVHLEMVCETASMMGQLARVTHPHGVPVYSGSGFDGLLAKKDLARRAARRDVPTVVLRITDWDDYGLRIARAGLEDSLAWAEHFGAEPGWLSFKRIALTRDQAREHGLLDEDGKAEAEGLPVPVMDAILRDAIESHQDPARREQTVREAAEERSRIPGLVHARAGRGRELMGIYIRLMPGVKVRIGRRGRVRVGLGPRFLRRWMGAGGSGWSTGAGPVSAYRGDRRRRRRRLR